ncbi:GP88 family protein [Cupriavidus sp. RAF12]|uniref:GP88 family protein n=1 Tax=Cupriavidus sp. RAF12 TaxID=3233050 RepID=UPI003F926C65
MNQQKLELARSLARSKYDSGWRPKHILGTGNMKLLKGMTRGVLTAGLSLAPADSSGVMNVCPKASRECKAFCLFGAGRGAENFHGAEGVNPTWVARILRTIWWKEHPEDFKQTLVDDIAFYQRRAARKGFDLAVRLNVYSDIAWEVKFPEVFKRFPEVQFYDYTAIAKRFDKPLPENYDLTFSLKEDNHRVAATTLKKGQNVSAVIRYSEFPLQFMDAPTVDGDEHDLRYLDPRGGHVVVLRPKGPLRTSRSPFIQLVQA